MPWRRPLSPPPHRSSTPRLRRPRRPRFASNQRERATRAQGRASAPTLSLWGSPAPYATDHGGTRRHEVRFGRLPISPSPPPPCDARSQCRRQAAAAPASADRHRQRARGALRAARRTPASAGAAAARPTTSSTAAGPVEAGGSTNYAIFWEPSLPPRSNSVSPTYNSLITRFLQDIGGSSLYGVATQYYQTAGGTTPEHRQQRHLRRLVPRHLGVPGSRPDRR